MRKLQFTFCLAVAFWALFTGASALSSDQAGGSLRPHPAVYAELQNSRDGTAYVIVMLKPPAVAVGTLDARRAAVQTIQDRVLTNLSATEFTPAYKYKTFAAMTGRANVAGLAKLAASGDVIAVGPDGIGHAHLDVSVPFINADDVHLLGYTGAGITVAVLDTGIDSDHPDLSDNIASGWYHFLDEGNTVGPGAEDDNGHGTNVAGIITSKGVSASVGVAPDADILAIKVLKSNGKGYFSDWAAGVDYVVDHQSDYDNLRIINMSLGSFDLFNECPCDNNDANTMLLQAAIRAAKHSGIVTFASSGNDCECGKMSNPACVSAATAVAAVYDQDLGSQTWFGCYDATTGPDKITRFSNRSACNELAAPGVKITAPRMNGGSSWYTGTSQASPHCAGVAALMEEKAATLCTTLSPNQIVKIMKDTGVATIDGCGVLPHPIRVDALAAVDELGSEPKPAAENLKWSQPPIETDPNSESVTYCGWNQQSWTQDPCGSFFARATADDFRCQGQMPVSSIHWWGSHLEWDAPFPPPQQPTAWWLRFWSNIPAPNDPQADPNYSRPGQLLWEIMVDADRVYVECAGDDYYPMMMPETCFQYYVDLEPDEYFPQADYNDVTEDSIFWLGISAVYPDDINVVYPWGWKTRPVSWMDDAVTYECRVVGWDPGPPPFPIIQCRFWPMVDPISGESIDLAFELGTDANYVKWEQPFTGIRDWAHYEDEQSMALEEPNGALNIWRMTADDWPCNRNTAITAIAWWGSYIGYRYIPCVDYMAAPPPVVPDYFLLQIWTDMVADDPCNTYDFSHPDELIWEYKAYDYDEVQVGYDKHPNWQSGPPREPVFRYSVELPREDWFFQDAHDGIYWLSVVGVYKRAVVPDPAWGWTNHPYTFQDNAAALFYDWVFGWAWEEILDQTGAGADMSFTLFTEPDPNAGTCWDPLECPCQPQGDATCDGSVNLADLFALKQHFGKCAPWIDPECCSDFNQSGCMNLADLFALKAGFGLPCPPGSTGSQKCP